MRECLQWVVCSVLFAFCAVRVELFNREKGTKVSTATDTTPVQHKSKDKGGDLYLQKDKVLLDNLLHICSAPEIAVQDLAGKHSRLLDVDHQPLVFAPCHPLALLIFGSDIMCISVTIASYSLLCG